MPTYYFTTNIDRPPEIVFETIADISNRHTWLSETPSFSATTGILEKEPTRDRRFETARRKLLDGRTIGTAEVRSLAATTLAAALFASSGGVARPSAAPDSSHAIPSTSRRFDTTVHTFTADSRIPDATMAAALAHDATFLRVANVAHTSVSSVVRHVAATAVRFDSGAQVTLVRPGPGVPFGFCGAQNCVDQIWTTHGGVAKKVLSDDGQRLRIFSDGSVEFAAEDNAATEDYTTYHWTGDGYIKTGHYDSQGNHTDIPATKTLVFDHNASGAVVAGDLRGDRPGITYNVTARARQTLTMQLIDGTHVGHIGVDRGAHTIAIAQGPYLALRIPQDGNYRLVVLGDGVDAGSYRLDIAIR